MDVKKKQEILDLDTDNFPHQEVFPLEPLFVFIGKEKRHQTQEQEYTSELTNNWLRRCIEI